MIAPSGTFCIAIPRASANAPPADMSAEPDNKPAYITPTAIPSGILCSVTASSIIVVLASLLLCPSALSANIWRCGIVLSSISKNKVPIQKPTTAGTKAYAPIELFCSMAGISRLHMEAAVITPAAKPVKARWTFRPSCFFIKKTNAAPKEVPINGIKTPIITDTFTILSPITL